jgi:hypothetical protein
VSLPLLVPRQQPAYGLLIPLFFVIVVVLLLE